MAGKDEEKLKVFISGFVLAKLLGNSSRGNGIEVGTLSHLKG